MAVLCRHAEAIVLLLEVIKGAPNLPDAYHTLGLLYEAQGDAEKSVNFFMISAHLSKVQLWLPPPITLTASAVLMGCHLALHKQTCLALCVWVQDSDVWKRVATMSTELGYLRQAIYCLSGVSSPASLIDSHVMHEAHWSACQECWMQAINRDKNDLDARWDRAVLYSEVDEPRKVSNMQQQS